MTDPAQSTALAPRPVREVRLVEDVVDVLDTARFEQMQRISSAMAAGSLIPDTLRGVYQGSGNARALVPFEEKVVVANIFRVVEQAVRWGMSPFAVIDCASVVHGRLMWEGKLVHAVVEARCGVRLNHRFGRMIEVQQPSGAKVMKFDPTEEGAGEALAVQTFGTFPGEDEERTIEGTVAQWKTTGTNTPWGSPANWKRQLRYRGSREWARAHSSAVMLGVITNDEMDDDADREVRVSAARRPRAEKLDIKGKLTAAPAGGFSADHVDAETAARTAETEDQRPEEERASDAVIEGTATTATAEQPAETIEETETVEEGATDGADGVTHDHEPAQTEEESIEELRRLAYEDGLNGEPVQAILAECDNDEERKIAAEAHANGVAVREAAAAKKDETPAPDAADDWSFETVGGAAPKGEVYLLSRDEPNDKGRLQTYRDGKAHSTVGVKGAAALKAYDGHPEPEDPALASQGGGKGAPADETPRSALFKELAALPSWLAIKPRLSAIYGEDDFKALTEEDQAAVRASLFPAVVEMKERTRDPVDWGTDVSCFVLWLDHTAAQGGKDNADAIEGTFGLLQDSAGWGKLTDAQKSTIEARVAARLSKLRGA